MATTMTHFGFKVTRRTRIAIQSDKWLDRESRTIAEMIARWEHVDNNRQALCDSLCEPCLYPEVIDATNKCISEISLVLDAMWAQIVSAQASHAQNIKRIGELIKKINN